MLADCTIRSLAWLRRIARCSLPLAVLLLASALPSRAQTVASRGWCESGNQQTTTSGLHSSNFVQMSFPKCTVTVFIHGGGLAVIFADAIGTPLSNPFTAQTNGQYLFYGVSGSRVDVQLSGGLGIAFGSTNPGFPTPITLSDILLGGGSSGPGSGYQTIELSGTPQAQRTTLNFLPGQNMNLLCADNSINGSTDCTFGVLNLGVTGININGGVTTTGIFNFNAGANITLTPGPNSVTITSTGSGGTSNPPGSPNSSLQYNQLGSFAGTDLSYIPGSSCFLNAPGTCNQYFAVSATGDSIQYVLTGADSLPTRGNADSLVLQTALASTSGSHIWLSSALSGTGVTNLGISTRTAALGANSIAQGLRSIATDDFSDATSSQTLQALVASVGLSKLSGSVALGVGLDVLPVQSWANTGVGVCCNTISESVGAMYGIRIGDQGVGSHTTGEQAALKILPQTAGSGTSYALKVDTGAGVSLFGDGISDNTLTAGQCVQTATISGLTRLTTTGSACGSGGGGGAPGGSTTQFQYNNASTLGGTTGYTWNNTSNVPSLALGAITTDINPFAITWTTNNSGILFHGLQLTVTNTAFSAGTINYALCGGSTGTNCFTLDTAGNAAASGSISTGNSGVAGNIGFPQGPLPGFGPLVNSVMFNAPTSVPSNYQITLPSAPCSGYMTWASSGSVSTMNCGGAPSQYLSTNYTNATTSFTNLMAFTAAANTNYTVSCSLVYSASAATSGPKIEFTGPAAPTAVTYSFQAATNQTVFSGASATAYSSSLGIGTSVATATPMPFQVTMGLLNGTTAGTVQLLAASQGVGTLTIQAGSYCQVTP